MDALVVVVVVAVRRACHPESVCDQASSIELNGGSTGILPVFPF
jgi:hypothetical protein